MIHNFNADRNSKITSFSVSKFLIAAGDTERFDRKSDEVVLVFRNDRRKRFGSVYMPVAPLQNIGNGPSPYPRTFGGLLGGRIIAGNANGIYQYNIETKNWIYIDSSVKLYVDGDHLEHNNFNRLPNCELRGCAINDELYLLWVGKPGCRFELLQFTKCKPNPTFNSNQVDVLYHDEWDFQWFQMDRLSQQNEELQTLERSIVNFNISIRQHFSDITLPSITNVGKNKVMFVGGVYHGKTQTSKRAFIGELTTDNRLLRWKELENITVGRSRAIIFKLKDMVYLTGGRIIDVEPSLYYDDIRPSFVKLCERFDIREEKWSTSKHTLPYPLHSASAVVSADDSFALITGGFRDRTLQNDKIIIFDEKNGFQVLDSNLRCSRSNHVSMLIQ